jgi:hypothetical protein
VHHNRYSDLAVTLLADLANEPPTSVAELVRVTQGDDVEDTHEVGYRLAITNPDGAHTVEQQAYYRADGDRISYLRVVCSGYRPVS